MWFWEDVPTSVGLRRCLRSISSLLLATPSHLQDSHLSLCLDKGKYLGRQRHGMGTLWHPEPGSRRWAGGGADTQGRHLRAARNHLLEGRARLSGHMLEGGRNISDRVKEACGVE